MNRQLIPPVDSSTQISNEMKRLIIIICVMFTSCKGSDESPRVVIKTRLGNIEVELYPKQAPITTKAFLQLVEKGFYDNATFYRVLKTDDVASDNNAGIIQGGTWRTDPLKNKDVPYIKHESTQSSKLTHTNGIISMARTDTGTAKSEFFICIGDQSSLDYGRRGSVDGQGFAAFGKVVSGMAIVRKIQGQKSHGDSFDQPIEIIGITRN